MYRTARLGRDGAGTECYAGPFGVHGCGGETGGGWCPSTEKKECERGIRVKGVTSPKLMRLACFRISVSPRRSFILRYLGMGAGGQLGAGAPPFPSQARRPPGPTCGRLASCAVRRGGQAEASPASQAAAPATCQTSARSHPSVHSPPGEGRRVPSGPCLAVGLSAAPVPGPGGPILCRGLVPPQTQTSPCTPHITVSLTEDASSPPNATGPNPMPASPPQPSALACTGGQRGSPGSLTSVVSAPPGPSFRKDPKSAPHQHLCCTKVSPGHTGSAGPAPPHGLLSLARCVQAQGPCAGHFLFLGLCPQALT